jgi:hypothetical protein
MLTCLLWVIIFAIVAVIVLVIFEQLMAIMGVSIGGQITQLLRLLVGLLVLIYFILCLTGSAGPLWPRVVP